MFYGLQVLGGAAVLLGTQLSPRVLAGHIDFQTGGVIECSMLLQPRTFEDRLASLYRGGSIIGGVYLGRGQEAFAASMPVYLKMGKDIYSPLIRDQAGRFAFGEPVIDAARTYLGSVKGPMEPAGCT